MRSKILFLFIIIIVSACAVQNEFVVSDAGERPEKAISSYYYALPMTVVKLEVDVEQELFIPGPYQGFAESYLGISDVSGDRSENYGIGAVKLTFLTEPDPDKYFSVNLLKGSFTATEYLELTNQGLVLNPSGWIRHQEVSEGTQSGMEYPYFTDLSITDFFSEVTDTLYKTIITDTSFVRLPIPTRQREVKTLELKAQEAANFILDIRRARFELIAGEIEGFPSGGALEFAIKELNRLEKEYLDLFIGKRFAESHTRTFFISPDGREQDIVLFNILGNEGLAEASSTEGTPVLLRIKPLDKLKKIQPNDIPAGSPGNELIYRIPDMALYRLISGNQVYYEERASLFQAGRMVAIPVK